jgi:Laminin B (Domain IV)
VLATLGLAACGIPSYANSVFEVYDEDWVIGDNGSETRPSLHAQGGNPGGYICGIDQDNADIWYFVAPPKFLGNASGTYGKRLTFDLKQGTSYDQIRGRDVILNGGGLAVVNAVRFAPGLDWTPYTFRLDASGSGWTIDDQTGNGPLASEAELRAVLGSLTSLRIRGEFSTGPQNTACLDNVFFGRD